MGATGASARATRTPSTRAPFDLNGDQAARGTDTGITYWTTTGHKVSYASGKPRNNFQLYSEWVDRDGLSTGRYTQAATWGGWVTTFRVDGWRNVDFVYPSAREIIPPAS